MRALLKKALKAAFALNERMLDFQSLLCAHRMERVADSVDTARKQVQRALSAEIRRRRIP